MSATGMSHVSQVNESTGMSHVSHGNESCLTWPGDWVNYFWAACIRGHFPQKSLVSSGSFAKNDLQQNEGIRCISTTEYLNGCRVLTSISKGGHFKPEILICFKQDRDELEVYLFCWFHESIFPQYNSAHFGIFTTSGIINSSLV